MRWEGWGRQPPHFLQLDHLEKLPPPTTSTVHTYTAASTIISKSPKLCRRPSRASPATTAPPTPQTTAPRYHQSRNSPPHQASTAVPLRATTPTTPTRPPKAHDPDPCPHRAPFPAHRTRILAPFPSPRTPTSRPNSPPRLSRQEPAARPASSLSEQPGTVPPSACELAYIRRCACDAGEEVWDRAAGVREDDFEGAGRSWGIGRVGRIGWQGVCGTGCWMERGRERKREECWG